MYEMYLDIDEIEHNILKAPEDQRYVKFFNFFLSGQIVCGVDWK